MRIGVIGSGEVGEALASGLIRHGHEVMRGSRTPAKLEGWKAEHGKTASVGTLAETARFGEMVVLAVKGTGAEEAVRQAGPESLAGKPVLDTTNPIAEKPPQDGVIAFFTGPNESLMERLQQLAPEAQFVKAFSCVGSALMIDPKLAGGPPTMFICGNAASAKQAATKLLADVGWETADLGTAVAARAIEPLAILWCIPGFLSNDWVHAFKLLRP
ncbi:MAG TPA: NAD(P)-binding domain-containing protein [Polyangiales bacterium]|nr:NAD(P)-binding domain-containing protein [Polyangiales bacterium]